MESATHAANRLSLPSAEKPSANQSERAEGQRKYLTGESRRIVRYLLHFQGVQVESVIILGSAFKIPSLALSRGAFILPQHPEPTVCRLIKRLKIVTVAVRMDLVAIMTEDVVYLRVSPRPFEIWHLLLGALNTLVAVPAARDQKE